MAKSITLDRNGIPHVFEFFIGDTVYLKTDADQKPRMITGYTLRPNGAVSYMLTCGEFEYSHYGVEISAERDILIVTTN